MVCFVSLGCASDTKNTQVIIPTFDQLVLLGVTSRQRYFLLDNQPNFLILSDNQKGLIILLNLLVGHFTDQKVGQMVRLQQNKQSKPHFDQLNILFDQFGLCGPKHWGDTPCPSKTVPDYSYKSRLKCFDCKSSAFTKAI